MRLEGQFPPSTRSQTILGWIGLAIVGAFLLPWIAIGVACILAGIRAISIGENSLIICLPAGLALLILPATLFYLDHRWYARISSFTLEEGQISYTFSRSQDLRTQRVENVCWVGPRMSRGRTRGYLIKFKDGSGIFVCRSLTNADELARALKCRV